MVVLLDGRKRVRQCEVQWFYFECVNVRFSGFIPPSFFCSTQKLAGGQLEGERRGQHDKFRSGSLLYSSSSIFS